MARSLAEIMRSPEHGKPSLLQCFHLFASAMYFFEFWDFFSLPCRFPIPNNPELYADYWKFLTYLNGFSQFLFFAFSCITDINVYYDTKMKVRDVSFAAVVFPYGMFTSVVFWALQMYEQQQSGQFYWLTHIRYILKISVLLVECYVVHHYYPRRIVGLAWTLLYGGGYIFVVMAEGLSEDEWVYPFLRTLTWYEKALSVVVSFIFQILMYLACETIKNLSWRRRPLPLKNIAPHKSARRITTYQHRHASFLWTPIYNLNFYKFKNM